MEKSDILKELDSIILNGENPQHVHTSMRMYIVKFKKNETLYNELEGIVEDKYEKYKNIFFNKNKNLIKQHKENYEKGMEKFLSDPSNHVKHSLAKVTEGSLYQNNELVGTYYPDLIDKYKKIIGQIDKNEIQKRKDEYAEYLENKNKPLLVVLPKNMESEKWDKLPKSFVGSPYQTNMKDFLENLYDAYKKSVGLGKDAFWNFKGFAALYNGQADTVDKRKLLDEPSVTDTKGVRHIGYDKIFAKVYDHYLGLLEKSEGFKRDVDAIKSDPKDSSIKKSEGEEKKEDDIEPVEPVQPVEEVKIEEENILPDPSTVLKTTPVDQSQGIQLEESQPQGPPSLQEMEIESEKKVESIVKEIDSDSDTSMPNTFQHAARVAYEEITNLFAEVDHYGYYMDKKDSARAWDRYKKLYNQIRDPILQKKVTDIANQYLTKWNAIIQKADNIKSSEMKNGKIIPDSETNRDEERKPGIPLTEEQEEKARTMINPNASPLYVLDSTGAVVKKRVADMQLEEMNRLRKTYEQKAKMPVNPYNQVVQAMGFPGSAFEMGNQNQKNVFQNEILTNGDLRDAIVSGVVFNGRISPQTKSSVGETILKYLWYLCGNNPNVERKLIEGLRTVIKGGSSQTLVKNFARGVDSIIRDGKQTREGQSGGYMMLTGALSKILNETDDIGDTVATIQSMIGFLNFNEEMVEQILMALFLAVTREFGDDPKSRTLIQRVIGTFRRKTDQKLGLSPEKIEKILTVLRSKIKGMHSKFTLDASGMIV
jgi:hypothetical protein